LGKNKAKKSEKLHRQGTENKEERKWNPRPSQKMAKRRVEAYARGDQTITPNGQNTERKNPASRVRSDHQLRESEEKDRLFNRKTPDRTRKN